MFIEYKTAGCKKQVRDLLRKRLDLKDKVRYHKAKISKFENEELPKIEKQLNFYLGKADNTLDEKCKDKPYKVYTH